MSNRFYSGMVLLDKEKGVTSHSALFPVKKLVKPSAVGHTGTLDKFAEGLMIVLVGPCTKFASVFTGFDKEYYAKIEFGRETETLDPEGAVIAEAPCPDKDVLETVIRSFTGEINQVPPVYSAVHVNGQRAYKKARSGEEVDMPSRKVTIYEAELIAWDGKYADLRVACSKGTYIRSLARDIGIACKSRASLAELKRTRVGDFDVSAACKAAEFSPDRDIVGPFDFLKNQQDVEMYHADNKETDKIRNGIQLKLKPCENEKKYTAVFNENNSFLAFGHRKEGKISYNFVIPAGWPVN